MNDHTHPMRNEPIRIFVQATPSKERPSLLTPVLLACLFTVYSRIQASKRVPKGVPWANQDEGFKRAKTVPEKLIALKQRYTDKGRSYIYGSTFTELVVIIPPTEIKWIISQPESVLSAQEMHRENLQSDWVFLDENIVQNPLHQEVIRGNMVRKLDAFTDPVMDELRQCFEDYWGTSTDWHEVNIWESMLKFYARTSNRMFVGLPLCRDEGYLAGCRGFASSIMVSIAVLKLLPAWTRFALGYLAVSPNWWYYRKASKYLLPIIQSRLNQVKENPKTDPESILPNDFVTWSIIYALNAPDPGERDPVLISKRVMTTNFAAIHTTTLTSTNFLIDLLGSDPKRGYLEALTTEIEAVDKDYNGQWSKLALGEMTRTDSALRESMRYSGFVNIGVERKVIAKDGVTISDGTHIPYWANIATPAWGIHHDEQIYPRPFEYDALRFSNQREALSKEDRKVHVGEEGLVEDEKGYDGVQNGSTKPEKDLSKVLEGKNLSTVTTSSQFMQFGHGKLSCPGRFFAVQEIKLMMAYMLQNYEIQHLPEKPVQGWLGGMSIPSTKTHIKIRRKLGASSRSTTI